MKKIILTSLLTFLFFNSFAQDTVDTTIKTSQLITSIKDKQGNQYFVGDKKQKNLKPYLLRFPESALEYKKSRNNLTATLISMGVAIGGLTTVLVSKDKETRKVAALYINLSALVGMVYFGIKTKQHMTKSIANYNKRVSLK